MNNLFIIIIVTVNYFLTCLYFLSFLWFPFNTYGLVCDPFIPGAFPKCFKASLLLLPLINFVFSPFGDNLDNWSKVKHSPPAFNIFSLASSLNFNAQTLIFGTVKNLSSFKTFPTITNIFCLFSSVLASWFYSL